LPEDHLAKFHKMADAKEMWEAIKSRFGGNDESKKMQKYLLKQLFEGFFVSFSEGLHKWYDRFQTLLSQLEIHDAGVSHEDANQKFLRSLPSSWSQVALIMRAKLRLDTLSFDDLYNNLRVFERDVNGTTASSSSNTHNVAFVSINNTSDINDDDLEEMDLKRQVAMISMRIKKFHKRTGRKLMFDTKDTIGFDKTKVECFNCHKIGHFARDCRAKWNQDSRRRDGGYNGNKARDNSKRPASQDDSKALVTIDGEAVDWSGHVEKDTQNFAMMAYSSSNSGSDNETSTVESDSKPVEYASSESDSSVETTTSMPAPVDNAPKIVCEHKVWTDAPIIEEYESDSNDDSVSNVQENIETPSFAFIDFVKHVKTPRENVKETGTPNHCPKIEKRDRNGHTRKSLGYAFTRKSCFVCGSFSHLIRDCDFHEKRITKQAALTKSKEKGTGQQAHKPVWNNVKRVNHQNNKELASPKQTALGKDISNPFMAGQTTASKENSNPFMADSLPITILLTMLATAQDLVIKKLQKKVKRIERKIKARTLGMTLFKIGNLRRKSLDKENVSKHGRYLKTRPMFEESDFDNIDDMVDEDND
nr:hypothetical protein [Tanacetum cinerariifolium]